MSNPQSDFYRCFIANTLLQHKLLLLLLLWESTHQKMKEDGERIKPPHIPLVEDSAPPQLQLTIHSPLACYLVHHKSIIIYYLYRCFITNTLLQHKLLLLLLLLLWECTH
jgi:hypothetical protein